MQTPRQRTRSFLLVTLVAVASAAPARAQVTPVGGHHPTVGAGGGLNAGVSPTGGYPAHVPLDLPDPRGDVPVPLAVVHTGSPRVSDAGAGFGIPLSYVRRSTGMRGRKPSIDGGPPVERLFLALGGSPMLMTPAAQASTWVPFAGDAYLTLRTLNGNYVARDSDGREYVFRPASADHDELWLLDEVRAPGGNDRIDLDYAVEPMDVGFEIRLESLRYSFLAGGTQSLFHIDLVYCGYDHGSGVCAENAANPRVLDRDAGEDPPRVRKHILGRIDVFARDNRMASSLETVLRSYQLTHQLDVDTGLPRLVAVDVQGQNRIGTLPVIRYQYATPHGDELLHAASVVVPRNLAGSDDPTDAMSSSRTSRSTISGPINTQLVPLADVDRTTTTHGIRDLTGDGLPDLVYQRGGDLVMVTNRTDRNGVRLDGTALPLAPATRIGYETTRAPRHETRVDDMVVNETWVALLDWNGDGRLDLVDVLAGKDHQHWQVLLNFADPVLGPGAVKWREQQVFIQPLRSWLEHNGYRIGDGLYGWNHEGRLPISRSRTWTHREDVFCIRTERVYDPATDSHSFQHSSCEVEPDPLTGEMPGGVYETRTIVEWQLLDENGDGFLDFLSNDKPAIRRFYNGCEESSCSPAANEEQLYWYPEDSPIVCECGITQEVALATPEELDEIWDTAWDPESGDPPPWPEGNRITAMYNHGGALFPEANAGQIQGDQFKGQPQTLDEDACGVEQWIEGEFTDPVLGDLRGRTGKLCGYADRNADGALDRYAGTAYENTRPTDCGPGSGDSDTYLTEQTHGLIDVSGDGIPDMVYQREGTTAWRVQLGDGVGFQQSILIVDAEFALSESTGTCGGASQAQRGVVDLDGDGVAELAFIQDGELRIARLDVAEGPAATARLVGVSNGYGATARIRWGSAKTDQTTLHQVPFPEVVVEEVGIEVEDGLGTGIEPTRHAFGGAELHYHPLLGRFVFAGYRRVVTLQGLPIGDPTGGHGSFVAGVATITDGRAPAPGHAGLVLAGRPSAMWRLEGAFDPDAQELLGVDPANESATRAGVQLVHQVAPLAAGPPPSDFGSECWEADPTTNQFPIGDTALCGRAGVTYTQRTDSWRGTQAPPSLANVLTSTELELVDGYGRPRRVRRYGDLRRNDDDVCVAIEWAQPADDIDLGRALPRSERVIDCSAHEPSTTSILAGTRYLYDGLSDSGDSYGAGRLTTVMAEVYDPVSMNKLSEHIAARYVYGGSYDQVESMTRFRNTPSSAKSTTTFTYDAWGMTATKIVTTATGVGVVLERRTDASVLPLVPTVSREPNGEELIAHHDSFGRVVREDRRGATTGTTWVLRGLEYDDSSDGRSVAVREIHGAAAEAGWTSAPATVARTYLDALGRERFSQVDLGPDYASTTLVVGWVEYDRLGRPVFAAAPFEHAESPFMPESLADPIFGNSYFYDVGGRVIGSAAATGQLTSLPNDTSETARVYVSRQEILWENGQQVVRSQGPGERQPGNSTHGAWDEVRATAIGWQVERARYHDGGRIELQRWTYDRLGQRLTTTRFQNPGSATTPVMWSSRIDSLGREIELKEPSASTLYRTFDELGSVYQTRWADGSAQRVLTTETDGLGRVVRELRQRVVSTQTTKESEVLYHYDVTSGSPNHVEAKNLLGRLSWIEALGVMTTWYGYDELGHPQAVSRVAANTTNRFVVRSGVDAGERLTYLHFQLPGIEEKVVYSYDSADRMRRAVWWGATGSETLADATAVDALGRARELVLGNGVTERYQYEVGGLERLQRQEITAADTYWKRELLGYDGAGRLLSSRETTIALPGPSMPVRRLATHSYDAFGRIARNVLSDPMSTDTLEDESFTYDALGNLMGHADNLGASDWSFTRVNADRDRLCAAQSPVVNTQNQTSCTHFYDGAGAAKQITYAGDTRAFTFDAGGRLTRATRSDGHVAQLKYDGEGRLAKLDLRQGTATKRRETNYGDLVSEIYTPTDGAVRIARRFPAPAGTLIEKRGIGGGLETVYAHADETANRLFTDRLGRVVQSLRYGAFGDVRLDTGATGTASYSTSQWNGGDALAGFGVHLLGARAYDPQTARFLSRDPIRHEIGSSASHPYSFAFGDPINFTDPDGLSPTPTSVARIDLGAGWFEVPLAALGLSLARFSFDYWSAGGGSSGLHNALATVEVAAAARVAAAEAAQAKAQAEYLAAIGQAISRSDGFSQTVMGLVDDVRDIKAGADASVHALANGDYGEWATTGLKTSGKIGLTAATFIPIGRVAKVGVAIRGAKAVGRGIQVAAGVLGQTVRAVRNARAFKVAAAGARNAALAIRNAVRATRIRNVIPKRMARVIPAQFANGSRLGAPNQTEVWVTGADDLAGITTSSGLAQRLTLVDSAGKLIPGPRAVIEFDAVIDGLASPVFRQGAPGFVGLGRTAGGAREFVLPNLDISSLKNVTIRIVQ